jgi:hypothetical protein
MDLGSLADVIKTVQSIEERHLATITTQVSKAISL